jgi:hypothetical protein
MLSNFWQKNTVGFLPTFVQRKDIIILPRDNYNVPSFLITIDLIVYFLDLLFGLKDQVTSLSD